METSGPAMAREAVGPLAPAVSRSEPSAARRDRGHFFRYAAPLGILALIGLGVANNEYLRDNREMTGVLSGLLSVGAVLPVAVAVRRPMVAWRVAYPMLFLGPINATGQRVLAVGAGADHRIPGRAVLGGAHRGHRGHRLGRRLQHRAHLIQFSITLSVMKTSANTATSEPMKV